MLNRLKALSSGALLYRQLRRLQREVSGLRAASERIAAALEFANAHQWPQVIPESRSAPVFEITYVDDDYQRELMDIEMRLTAARGQAPTEEEILQDFLIRHPEQREDAPQAVEPTTS